MKKIIAISGTHGTGKSTTAYSLCNLLKKLGKNVVVLDELAREAPFDINQVAEDKTQVWLSVTQTAKELEYANIYDLIITDRSVLDAFAYGLVLDKENKWSFRKLESFLVEHIKLYYKKLYVLDPRAFDFNIKDGVRDTDPQFRQDVHNSLIEIYDRNNIDYELVFNTIDIFVNFL